MDERCRIFAPLDLTDLIDPPGQLTYTPLDNTCRRILRLRMRMGKGGEEKEVRVRI